MKHINWIPLFSTNFLGVFNDNFLKELAKFIAITWVLKEQQSSVIAIASAMLVIPYLLFSPFSGYLSKTKYKIKIIQIAKLIEIPIMLVGALGFYLQSIPIIISAIGLMGLQSCLFSPAKYGLIRDIGGMKKISFGTGGLEMTTFLAILLATFLSAIIAQYQEENSLLITLLFFSIAILGFITSKTIRAKESMPESDIKMIINPIRFLYVSYKNASKLKGINYAILGLGIFWMIGSFLQMNLVIYGQNVTGINRFEIGQVMAAAAIGIACGSFLTGYLSIKKINLHLAIIGAVGLIINSLLIYFIQPTFLVLSILVFFAAFFSGMYKIPLNAWVQEYSKGRIIGDMIAYMNQSVFIFILISAAVFPFIEQNIGASFIFIIIALLMLIGILCLVKLKKIS